jgi:quinol monooxygenase YgiN
MKHIIATYRIKPATIATVQASIKDFVAAIRKHEPGTLRYYSFQNEADSCAFTHVMAFQDGAAEKRHEATAHLKVFVEKLYPCCETPPTFAEVALVAQALK